MKIRRLIMLLVAFVLLFSTFAFADGSDQRMDQRIRQARERIEKGIHSGSLTRKEAKVLLNELDNVRDDRARMRRDGRLSRHEQDRLDQELDGLELRISQLKHNDNSKGPDRGR